ncbi:MAG: drug/metabolite transporter (DMT)-like permease [Colwellia sp.]|jgi:drug/metabolite transporter (DMT)-like permease|uniref:DMT family transporter n=1 Tax=unclassified Colwellia TaxID=196834 RepID=UPI0015F54B6E|nr:MULTISPECIES: DMT family transporter [unclassified Colwellia]MBA6252783.1 DMT family transporter [Colwellia sp. MB3u-55]MBA6396882.1 DMT family transporter [Colwellia sp. BRX10-4]
MSVPIAYFAVILIWSTTPLAIVWSSETIHPTLAVLLRMLIAVVPGWFILKAFRIELPWHKKALKLYSFSAIGIFGGMLFAYLAAGYISSGLMSLMFGLAPILSGVLSQRFLAESALSTAKKIALAIAICGLATVCFDKISLKGDGYIGIIAVLIAVSFFSLSGVLVKSVDVAINPMATTLGSLLLSLPLFTLVWLIFDGNIAHQTWSNKSILSVVYLGVIGSLVGFIAYFYILQRLKASTVALITMITPVIAISLGLLLNNETINFNLIVGALAIIAGLAIYQWGDSVIKHHRNKYAQ